MKHLGCLKLKTKTCIHTSLIDEARDQKLHTLCFYRHHVARRWRRRCGLVGFTTDSLGSPFSLQALGVKKTAGRKTVTQAVGIVFVFGWRLFPDRNDTNDKV